MQVCEEGRKDAGAGVCGEREEMRAVVKCVNRCSYPRCWARPVRGRLVRGRPVRGRLVRGQVVRGRPVRGRLVRGRPASCTCRE